MNGNKVPIPQGKLEVDHDAIFAGFQKDLNKTKDMMHVVVLVLLVMVGAMIFSLQIAIWQTKQPDTFNITIPDITIETRAP